MTAIDAGRLRRARWGVSMLFMANGAMWANVTPRLPEIREHLGVSYGVFGVAVAFGSIGAIALGLIAGPMVRRFGSARVAAIALILEAFAIWGAGVSTSVFIFAAFLFLNGALDSNTDVAQNDHGLVVQRRIGKSIINGLHAMWSAGAALGGVWGAAAVWLGLSIPIHLAVSTALFAVIGFIAQRLMLPQDAEQDSEEETAARAVDTSAGRRRGIPGAAALALGMLGLIGIAGALVEDSGFTWASSYLHDELGAASSIAGFGLVALMTFHFIGRIVGDKLVDRYGERMVARVGGLVTAVGMGLALAWPTIPGTIAGFAVAGLGVATTVPAAFAASETIPGLQRGTGLTIVSWILRVAFLASPPLVGAVADATSLRTGLMILPIAGIAVVLLAGFLTGKPGAKRSDAPEPQPVA